MAIEDLTEKVEKVQRERAQRYPLLDLVDNRKEIREISENTIKYMAELYPELAGFSVWELVPRIVIEFHKKVAAYLANELKPEIGEVSFKFGDFITFEIQQSQLSDADKEGTFNPNTFMGPELVYDNENPENNSLKIERPVIEMNSAIETICTDIVLELSKKYDVRVTEWNAIYKIVISFYRIVRDYLINHRHDSYYGLTISLVPVIDFRIEAYTIDPDIERSENKTEVSDENTGYHIYFGNSVDGKMKSKDDDKTEKH